jgi:hypothetical protein
MDTKKHQRTQHKNKIYRHKCASHLLFICIAIHGLDYKLAITTSIPI